MIVFYGDYKDLNHVRETIPEVHRPNNDKEVLLPLWEKFKSGENSLKEARISNDDLCRMPKIVIRNQVYENNEYTTYALAQGNDSTASLSHFKSFPNKFIDKENGFIVLEVDETRGYTPKSLEEVKAREIAFEKGIIETMEKSVEELGEDVIRIGSASNREAIARWEAKTEARWFHETELTKKPLTVEQIAKELVWLEETVEPCDNQGHEYYIDCKYNGEVYSVYISFEYATHEGVSEEMQAAKEIYKQLTKEDEREER